MYAAKFKLKTTAAVFKIAGKDLGRPLGVRAKSVIGVDENKVPKKGTLKGLLYSEYHTIPQTMSNIKATWKPGYLKLIEKSKDSLELIEYLRKEERNKEKSPLIQLGIRLRNTISSQGAACLVCGTTEDVQMHHIKPLKNLQEINKLKRHIAGVNIPQIPLCRKHHLEAHKGN